MCEQANMDSIVISTNGLWFVLTKFPNPQWGRVRPIYDGRVLKKYLNFTLKKLNDPCVFELQTKRQKHWSDLRIKAEFCLALSFCRFIPTASTSVLSWSSTKPRLAAPIKELPPTGWRTNWSQTTATSLPFPCTFASLSSACPSKPPTQWSWSALGQESLPSWASSRRGAGSKSKVLINTVCQSVCGCLSDISLPQQGWKNERKDLQICLKVWHFTVSMGMGKREERPSNMFVISVPVPTKYMGKHLRVETYK